MVIDNSIGKSPIILQRVIDLLPTRVFWKDKDLNYLGCNMRFALDAGKKHPSELIGKNDFDMGWKNEAKQYRADDMKVISTGKEKINFEEPQTTPDGKTIWLRTSKLAFKDDAGEIIGVIGLYDDITEIKLAQDQLALRIAELERFKKLSIDRELKMIELKKKIRSLQGEKV